MTARIDAWDRTSVVDNMDAAWRAMRAGGIAVVLRGGAPLWVWFLCPCGCGMEVLLPGQAAAAEYRARRQFWRVDVGDGLVSLSPSVVVLTCGAHFFVRRSRLQWCAPARPQRPRRSPVDLP